MTVYPLSYFQVFLSLLVIALKIFRHQFFIFYLDKQNPVGLEKLSMSAGYPLCPRVQPCVCGCIHETPFFLARLSGFNSSAEGSPVDSCPDFPGLKVGKIYTLPF